MHLGVAYELVHVVHDVVDVVVELFAQSHKLLRQLGWEGEGAAMEEVVEVVLADLGLVDLHAYVAAVAVFFGTHELLLVLIVSTIVILGLELLLVARLEGIGI